MKPSSWDKQLGLASPLERAARQSNQTDNPSKNVVGAGCQSPHPRPPEGRGEVYLLTSSFIGGVARGFTTPRESRNESIGKDHFSAKPVSNPSGLLLVRPVPHRQ